MSTNSSVVLRFMAQGQSTVTGIFDNLKKQKQDLEKGVSIPVDADDKKATTKLDDVNHMLADLNKKQATASADVNDSLAKAKLLQINLTLKRLNDYTAKPTVSVNGLAKAEIQLLKIDAELDKINGKNVSPGSNGASTAAKTAGAAGGAAASGSGDITSILGKNPVAVIAGLTAGLLALPFLAQAAGAGIVGGLGAGLAGMAIYAAQKNRLVAQSFLTLKQNASHDLTEIGAPFVGVMQSIYKTATDTLNRLTPVFAGATGVIAGPFKAFSDTLIKTFNNPVVKQSIAEVANSFGLLLTNASPALAGAVQNIAVGFTKLSLAVAKNPRILGDFITDMGKVVGGLITTIAWLATTGAEFEAFTNYANRTAGNWEHNIGATFDRVRHNIAAHMSEIESNTIDVWNKIWTQTVGRAIQIGHSVESTFNSLKNTLASDGSAMANTIRNSFDNIISFARSLPGRIKSAIGGVGSLLSNDGRSIINGLFSGMKAVLSNVKGWVKSNLYTPITNAVKSLFGIKSPSTVMAALGGHLVGGLFKGILSKDPNAFISKIFGGLPSALGALIGKGLIHIEKLPAKALKALGSLGSKLGGFFSSIFGSSGGSGVARWAGVVAEALALNGLPQSLSAQVLHQISTESGGNPNAINLTDSNAAMGDPSRGLLQTIGSTFAAFHVAGTSSNIYDPLANVAAAISYAKSTYGPNLMRGSMGLGSGHGYQFGTVNATKGWHMVGERGPELMGFRGHETVVPNNALGGGDTYVVNVQVPPLSNARDVGAAVSDALAYHARHGGSVPFVIKK